jgi:hypothetical protein
MRSPRVDELEWWRSVVISVLDGDSDVAELAGVYVSMGDCIHSSDPVRGQASQGHPHPQDHARDPAPRPVPYPSSERSPALRGPGLDELTEEIERREMIASIGWIVAILVMLAAMIVASWGV